MESLNRHPSGALFFSNKYLTRKLSLQSMCRGWRALLFEKNIALISL